MRAGVVMTLCALAACAPAPRTALELVSAPRAGELRFRLDNPGPEVFELSGYDDRGLFHADWNSRVIQCAPVSDVDAWRAVHEPAVNGTFTGVRLRVTPGDSATIVVNHLAHDRLPESTCRLSLELQDGTEVVSKRFPMRRLDGVMTN